MRAQIRPTRLDATDRFPMVGFTIRTDGSPQKAEIAIATEPSLLSPAQKGRRTTGNFYSTRAQGPVLVPRGEAVYVLPPHILARFIGQQKLYFGLATAPAENGASPQVAVMPDDVSPYISIAGLTGRGLRRVRMLPNRQDRAAGYGLDGQKALEWAGDAPQPGTQRLAPDGATAPPPASGAKQNGAGQAPPSIAPYDDGFGPLPEPPPASQAGQPERPMHGNRANGANGANGATQPTAQGWTRARGRAAAFGMSEVDPDSIGIESGVYTPDEDMAAARALGRSAWSRAQTATAPEYTLASRFAAAPAFHAVSDARSIDRIVIHVTDGPTLRSAVNTFTHPNAKTSAHYIIAQDGEVVQCVHENDIAYHARGANSRSIGIEHVAIKRGGATYGSSHFPEMFPTDVQYEASAALVSHLCDKYGVPTDREHILGHAEADTATSHTSCPDGANWDWEHFMRMVRARMSVPSGAEGLAARGYRGAKVQGRRAGSRSLARVTQDYTPSNPADAARALADFMQRDAAWAAGVPDTGFFPHSAICHLEMTHTDGKVYYGTGFYVAQELILSAAHNFTGMASVRVRAGRNGETSCLSDFKVSPADWSIHPGYVPKASDFDLAVVRVSTPPPGGRFFDVLEELNVSRDSPIIVCGYGAETVDPLRQHLDGDQARTLSGNGEILRYSLQTEKGNSGSPVFYVWGYEDEAQQMSVQDYRLVGVHSAGYDATLNQACALTEGKIAWIRGRGLVSVAHSLGRPASKRPHAARAMGGGMDFTLNWDEVQLVQQPTDMSCWAAAAAMVIGWRDRVSIGPETVAELGARVPDLQAGLDPAHVRQFADAVGLVAEPQQSYTIEGFRGLLERNGPLWIGAAVPGLHAIAVTGLYQMGEQTFVRVSDPWDRAVGSPGAPGPYASSHVTGSRYILRWEDFVAEYERAATDFSRVNLQILHAGGAEGRLPNIGPDTPAGYAQGLGRARAMDADGDFTINWDEVEPVAQPTNFSCWAAAGAMLVGWRDRISISPGSIAEICGRTSATGLDPAQVEQFAGELGLIYEQPACYTADGFRSLLERYGPLWVAAAVPGLHAIIVTGMYRSGGETYVRITDPWDRAVGTPGAPGAYAPTHVTGSRYILRWEDFVREYERAAMDWSQVNLQILHSAGTALRQPNRGPAVPSGYAQGMARVRAAATPRPQTAAPRRVEPRRATVSARGLGEAGPAPGTETSRNRFEKDGVRFDLAQLGGMVAPQTQPVNATTNPMPGPRVVLDDWPFIEGRSGRTQAVVAIDWTYGANAVGNLVVDGVGGRTADGCVLAVTADILAAAPASPTVAALLVCVTYRFGGAREAPQTAVTEITLHGDGRVDRRSEWREVPAPVMPVAPGPAPALARAWA